MYTYVPPARRGRRRNFKAKTIGPYKVRAFTGYWGQKGDIVPGVGELSKTTRLKRTVAQPLWAAARKAKSKVRKASKPGKRKAAKKVRKARARRNPPIMLVTNRPRRRKARSANPRGYVRRRGRRVSVASRLARTRSGRWSKRQRKPLRNSGRRMMRRRNPNGIVAQVKGIFTIDNAKLAGAGLSGLVATSTLTDTIGKLLGRERQFTGAEGVVASAVSVGLVTGGVSLIIKDSRVLGAVAIGGLIATAIRAIRWLMPGQAEKMGVGHTGASASRAMQNNAQAQAQAEAQKGMGSVTTVDQIAAGESAARGLGNTGDFLELRGLGQIPASAIEGMGDFMTTTSGPETWGAPMKDIVASEQF